MRHLLYFACFAYLQLCVTALQWRTIAGRLLITSTILVAQPSFAIVDESTIQNLEKIKKGYKALQLLVDKWEEKTTYCNFGELQRDILSVKNKEVLYKVAAKGSLLDYDKSDTMNVMCKKDPMIVRAYAGLYPESGNDLLYNAEKVLQSEKVISSVDPEKIDEYITLMEEWQQLISSIDASSYSARNEYASTETSSKNDRSLMTNDDKNLLAQCKKEVIKAAETLGNILNMIDKQ
jgi:hypothetical protein